jgi:ferredoxin-nitrite reductase
MANPVEVWKAEKHGFDVWPELLQHAAAKTPMREIDTPDLERMKWHGVFYRKRDTPGTYMLRIRLTACELSAEQAKAIAYVAYQFGYGIVDLTTRANIQVQGLPLEHVPTAIERLTEVGLTCKQTGHDNIRNVFGHPFSGVDPAELIDTRPLCREITQLFLDNRDYSDLPRKMNIALSGHSHHGAHYWSQDISFLACRISSGAHSSRREFTATAAAANDGDVLFQTLIGGTQGQNPHLGWHLPVLVRPDQVVDVTRALLSLFREQGSREKRGEARFRFLVERIGVGGVLEYLERNLDFPLRPGISEPQPPSGYDDLIGWFRQHDPHLWTMGLSVPVGRMGWQQLEGLARLSRKWGDGQLRVTPDQGVAVINIPSGFKDAAATDAAALGLSLHADTLARNTVACTGIQFCNIAVTETKGHMLRLIEKLRQRALMLHGIRIHMSGCPSSCAQHFTADIGLKGVRVRRLIGTREGFDVYLGGGIAGQIHLGLPYKLGVDVDQLPQLVEDCVQEYYLKHKPGQTFSAYWRETLRNLEAAKVTDGEYIPPVWVCENCDYRHHAEDPPVYCPSCAGLRRHFARIDEQPAEQNGHTAEKDNSAKPREASHEDAPRSDGFLFAALESELSTGEGLAVEVAGSQLALFRIGGEIRAIDDACPHEGAPLSQGEIADGVVTCPWHGWTFDGCTGCSLDPAGHDVAAYEVKTEDGKIYVKPQPGSTSLARLDDQPAAEIAPPLPDAPRPSPQDGGRPRTTKALPPKTAKLTLLEIIQETPDTKTFRLDNSAGKIPRHRPGQFAKVGVPIDGQTTWRSFTISSSPTQCELIDLTVKRNPAGDVSNFLHDRLAVGDQITLKAPQGGYYFSPSMHQEPLVLIAAGSGITPMMSILRFLKDTDNQLPCTLLYGARTPADVIFADQIEQLAQTMPSFTYAVSLTEPPATWTGLAGRLNIEQLQSITETISANRYFLCGPGGFMDSFQQALLAAGVPADRVHTEQFQKQQPQAEVQAS